MRKFAELYNRLDETADIHLRVSALLDYLHQANAEDRLHAIALLADKRPRKLVSLTQIKTWGLEASGLPEWLFEESLKSVGDLGETVSLVIPKSDQVIDESLSFWLKHIETLSKSDDEARRAGVIEAWNLLDANSRFIFNKLITGGFRTSYPQIMLTNAISKYIGKPIPRVAHRLMSNWNPIKTTFGDLFTTVLEIDPSVGHYPFFSAQYLEKKPKSLGDPSDWYAEYKWDGIRVQLVVRNGNIWVWTTEQELITLKTPELLPLLDKFPDGTVLDGELLAYKNGHPLSLKDLVQRIGKKKPTKKILENTPLKYMVYDILEHHGEDIRDKKWIERRSILEQLMKPLLDSSIVQLSPIVEFSTWKIIAEILKTARSQQAIGLLLKDQNSIYWEGRGTAGWWKWKVPKLSVKTILLYAQSGGWSGGESTYTFAVWEGDQLVPLTKTMDGLAKEEISEIGTFVKKNTIERFGPVRSIKPELVFELIFDTIDISTRHKCGLVLRNPSVLKWKRESDISEADSLEAVKALLNHE